MEFWMVGTIHCKGGHSISSRSTGRPNRPAPPTPTIPPPHPNRSAPPSPAPVPYLLDQPHLELGEEQLGEEAEQLA